MYESYKHRKPIIQSTEDEDLILPTEDQVREVQEEHAEQRPRNTTRTRKSLWNARGRIFYTGWSGRTTNPLASSCALRYNGPLWGWVYRICTSRAVLLEYREGRHPEVCIGLHSLHGKTGLKISRPVPETLHAEKPNDVIRFDFFYMGKGKDE